MVAACIQTTCVSELAAPILCSLSARPITPSPVVMWNALLEWTTSAQTQSEMAKYLQRLSAF